MDKKMKLEALNRLVEESDDKMEAHKAKCPKCGYEWMMGEDEYEDDEEDEEDEEDEGY